MNAKPHRYFTISSNLLYISAGLGLLNGYLLKEELVGGSQIGVAIFTIFFLIGLGLLVRQGYQWIKWLLLIIIIISFFGLPFFIANILQSPLVGIINIIQTILQFSATILVFIAKTKFAEDVIK